MATYVFVHGAFTGGWIWKHVASQLRASGHEVHTPTLEGCAERRRQIRQNISMATHVNEMVDYLFYHDLHDIILVGTSISGITISKIADAVPERIGRLVFIDALMPLPGEKTADLVIRSPEMKFQNTEFGRGPERNYLKDSMLRHCDPKIRDWAVERFTPWPRGAGQQVGEPMEFWNRSWTVTVINCRQSQNPAESHQRRTAERLKGTFLEIDTGHYPMLSKPEELARLLL